MASLGELTPWLEPYAVWFVDYMAYLGLNPRVTSTYRSAAVQEVLYERYLRGQTEFPVAPPGRSWHQYRRAFDMVADDPELAGSVWRQMGGTWSPSDRIHFQA
jgi:hypothetical protein